MHTVAFISTALTLPARATRRHDALLRQLPVSAPVRPRRVPLRMDTGHEAVKAPAALTQDIGFSWVNQWYPVCWEEDFDNDRPMPFMLWDRSLVMYRDSATHAFVVLDDVCPHRAAPLSEGRLFNRDVLGGEKGEIETILQCAYHGWCFDCQGKCVNIPQARAGQRIPAAANLSKRYPTAVMLGLVFVWFGDPDKADISSIPFPDHVKAYDPKDCLVIGSMTRIVPCDILTLHENVIGKFHVKQ